MKKNYSYHGKNCIVTGGSGFIGQNIVKALVDDGANVWIIDNFSYNAQRDNVNRYANIIYGDVREGVYKKLPDIDYDYFFHFAGPSSIILFNRQPRECLDITITGFINAIKFCEERNIRLVYPSSGSVYAGTPCPQPETSKLDINSINAYARAKLVLEYIQKAYSKNCDALAVRIFAGYGPSEMHKGDFASVVYMFCQQMVNGEIPVIFGDGKQKRDFIFIDDVINIILTLTQYAKEPVVNVGSGTNISFNDIVDIINEILETDIRARHIEKPNIYLEETLAETSLMKIYYGSMMTPIKEGITRIIDDLKGKNNNKMIIA